MKVREAVVAALRRDPELVPKLTGSLRERIDGNQGPMSTMVQAAEALEPILADAVAKRPSRLSKLGLKSAHLLANLAMEDDRSNSRLAHIANGSTLGIVVALATTSLGCGRDDSPAGEPSSETRQPRAMSGMAAQAPALGAEFIRNMAQKGVLDCVDVLAVHGGYAHRAHQIRIFSICFFDASPARIARDVDDRREHELHATSANLASDDGEDALGQCRVPSARECYRLREMSGAQRGVTMQALFVEQHRNAQARVAHGMALHGIDQRHGLAFVAIGNLERRVALLLPVAGAGEVADAGGIQTFRGGRVEIPFGIQQLGFLQPDRSDLRDLFLERDEQPGVDRVTPVPIGEPRYDDRDVQPGQQYVYAVVAVDSRVPLPNMSAPSAEVTETAR